MRRDTFLKSLAALAATGALPLSAWAAPNVKMMIPANPGGGWDTTGRALGKAMTDGKLADTVTYDNKGGAAGALGLAQSRYRQGVSDFLEVLTAQRTVLQAEQSLADSTATISSNLVALYKALGGGWEGAYPEGIGVGVR